jgi:uncharacterized protein YjiS (DUF1127 family)
MTDTDDELDRLLRAYRTLPLEQRDRLVQRIIQRAKIERAAAFRALLRRFWSWIELRAAITKLQRLDDRMLKDIGLHRSEIPAAVNSSDRFNREGSNGPSSALTSCPVADARKVGTRPGKAA